MSRTTKEEMDEAIFSPKQKEDKIETKYDDKGFEKGLKREDAYFTEFGKHDDLVDDKPVTDENSESIHAKQLDGKFYLKIGRAQIFDPWTLFQKDNYATVGNDSIWKWETVKVNVFDLYVRYLRTKNKMYYTNATREMI